MPFPLKHHGFHFKTDSICLLVVLILSKSSLSHKKFRYVRDNTREMSQCVVDIEPATGIFNCAHQAGIRGSYAYFYVAANQTCHICLHSREVGNRSLEHLPVSEYPVYQRGTVKPVCNDQLYNNIHHLWFIQQCVLMKTECINLLMWTISAFWSSSRWPLATSMSSRMQRSSPLGGLYRQVSLYSPM